jgi:DMSO/TMAO reductase YedYZ molybdopterin-dependent catalytic subunit
VTFGVLGFAVGIAATSRADAGLWAWMPGIAAGVVAAVVVRWLTGMLPGPVDASAAGTAEEPSATSDGRVDRRRFLLWTGVAAAAGIVAAVGGAALRAGSQAVSIVRRAIVLPTPAVTAAAAPAGAELAISGLAPVVTPNADFYRIDTALVVPQVDPATWSLRIHGLVERELVLSWDELLALPLEESWTTLTCVSNEVGGDLIGNALWLGYPIRHLLDRVSPTADADMVLSRSVDGFTASTPIEVLRDDGVAAILAVAMNGEPLPVEHGFPVRMVVPGLYGYVSATKWVTDLEVTRFDHASAYWTDRGWSERGPIKLESRIDVPRAGAAVPAGDTVIAGVAWQQHVGVAGVEVQVDDGAWRPATLATAISDDTWVQWSIPWTAERGRHTVRCRATSTAGEVQTDATASVVPDGATGWHTREVSVS